MATESGFVPRRKIFSCPQAKADKLKICTQNRIYWLSVAERLGVGLKGLICTIDNNDTTVYSKTYATYSGLGPP